MSKALLEMNRALVRNVFKSTKSMCSKAQSQTPWFLAERDYVLSSRSGGSWKNSAFGDYSTAAYGCWDIFYSLYSLLPDATDGAVNSPGEYFVVNWL